MHAQRGRSQRSNICTREEFRDMGQRRWIRRTLEESPAAQAPAPTPPAPDASIAPGCELEGRLQLEGPLTVYGDFKGEIACHEDVVVAPGGTVQGPIEARSVEVLGSVVGDLHARREIVLRAGCRLHGDVCAASLVVERGACFEGRSRRLQPIAPRPASGEAVPEPREAASGEASPETREATPGIAPPR
jgi:cytoskeletal protein CcmA (bactofilin family)